MKYIVKDVPYDDISERRTKLFVNAKLKPLALKGSGSVNPINA